MRDIIAISSHPSTLMMTISGLGTDSFRAARLILSSLSSCPPWGHSKENDKKDTCAPHCWILASEWNCSVCHHAGATDSVRCFTASPSCRLKAVLRALSFISQRSLLCFSPPLGLGPFFQGTNERQITLRGGGVWFDLNQGEERITSVVVMRRHDDKSDQELGNKTRFDCKFVLFWRPELKLLPGCSEGLVIGESPADRRTLSWIGLGKFRVPVCFPSCCENFDFYYVWTFLQTPLLYGSAAKRLKRKWQSASRACFWATSNIRSSQENTSPTFNKPRPHI